VGHNLKYKGYDSIIVDELKEEMDNIKILCVAAHVMEITRNLERE
jgi:hypothetical protein